MCSCVYITMHRITRKPSLLLCTLLLYLGLFLAIHLCRANLKQSYSMLQYGHKLERRLISAYAKYSILDCVEDCLRTTRCKSINYYQGAHFCQTNFENKRTVSNLYKEKPGWIYSDIGDWDKEIAGACSKSDCSIHEKCIPKPFGQISCVISDCGIPSTDTYSMDRVQEWDAIGITGGMHITCAFGYKQQGSELFVCRQDGSWRKDLKCIKISKQTECENKKMNISCSNGTINIDTAIYGRTDDNICPGGPVKSIDCRSDVSEKPKIKACNGKPQCNIDVSNNAFGDPCSGTAKYLEVGFICIEK